MRVVHTLPEVGEQAAGPSYSVPALCRALGRTGVETVLMTQDTAPLDPSPGFRHQIHATRGLPRAIRPSPDLHAALRAAEADVLHTHSLWMMANIYPGRVARDLGVPLVVAPRGTLSPQALAWSRWKKRAVWHVAQRVVFDHAACLHATAEKEVAEIRAFGWRGPIALVPNGIDIPASGQHDPNRGRELLFLARLHPLKGLDLLLDVWRDLPDAVRADWTLTIAGPGQVGHREAMQARVAAEAIPATRFTGALYDGAKQAAYQRADLYVLPTETENFGMTVAEALANGTPVITTQGAPWAGLQTEGCGWWIPRTHAALTDALTDAMARPRSALDSMGQSGRIWMERAFGWQTFARQLAEVYAWLASDGATPPEVIIRD